MALTKRSPAISILFDAYGDGGRETCAGGTPAPWIFTIHTKLLYKIFLLKTSLKQFLSKFLNLLPGLA